jgi:hypothetical protein
MARQLKTPQEKLKTKISNLIANDISIKEIKQKIRVGNKVLFSYDNNLITYTKNRYFPSKIENLIEENFEVCFPLTGENILLLGANISNPPKGAKLLIDLFRKTNKPNLNKITIGSSTNGIFENSLSVTKEFYENITKINKEEGKDKAVRFNNRVKPFLKANFSILSSDLTVERDYSLLLEEIIASGQVSQQDIIELTSKLEQGNSINVVIEKQLIKQAEWLIEKIQEILDEGKITTQKAKDLGNLHFGFPKTSISGPEHLMEKILTKYGKYTLFGVPVLLNTDKYVINVRGLSRSQFDIVLINHLSDIEVVELKRSDTTVLDYDEGRNKFYASKDLSIAVSQAERYISAVYRENDDEYKINNQKIRDFLNTEIGGVMTVEIVRPKALIILGSFLTLAPDYEKLEDKTKRKVSKDVYILNYLQAYKELKEAYKNIHILTYSELIENARTRLIKQDD